MFALFEDDLTIIHGTAGFAAFGSSTSGYGYSPPSATLSRDDNQLKMCLLCTYESSVTFLPLKLFLIQHDVYHDLTFSKADAILAEQVSVLGKIFYQTVVS